MAACNQIRRHRVQGDGDGQSRIISWPRRRSVRGRGAGAGWRRHNVGRPDHRGLGGLTFSLDLMTLRHLWNGDDRSKKLFPPLFHLSIRHRDLEDQRRCGLR
jgi:hypothetical protein